MVLKRERWPKPDAKQIEAGLKVTDEVVRGDAVRGLCPCHAGWDLFEQHVGDVNRALRDPSRAVRRHALHVFDDAARMQSVADLQYSLEPGEEKIEETRGRYFRSMEERVQARRDRKIRKNKKRHKSY